MVPNLYSTNVLYELHGAQRHAHFCDCTLMDFAICWWLLKLNQVALMLMCYNISAPTAATHFFQISVTMKPPVCFSLNYYSCGSVVVISVLCGKVTCLMQPQAY